MTPACDPRLDKVIELLQHNVDTGIEVGAALCVIEDSEVLLDTWAGSAGDNPWRSDTLVPVWSISKLMVNLAALLLHDGGALDLDRPVADYWPEFAAQDKDMITVAHLLSHTSGVSGWDQPVTVDDLYDWDKSTAMLAAQKPWWEPGSAAGYHLLNQGHLVGEVIRRVTGISVGTFIAQHVAGPLNADFHIGLAPEHDRRVSPMIPPQLPADTEPLDPDGIPMRTMTGPFVHAREANSERWRRAEIPAANGIGSARAVATIQSMISHGGEAAGIRFLSEKTIDRIFSSQASGIDRVLGLELRWGQGWALPTPRTVPSVRPGHRCFWGGLGGSFVLNDFERRRTIAYTMNRMVIEHAPGTRIPRPVGDSRIDSYLAAIEEALA